jgi:hypothetical protein
MRNEKWKPNHGVLQRENESEFGIGPFNQEDKEQSKYA